MEGFPGNLRDPIVIPAISGERGDTGNQRPGVAEDSASVMSKKTEEGN